MLLPASRARARAWFDEMLVALAPSRLVRAQMDTVAWGAYRRVLVLALGKAAGGLLHGWWEAAPPALLGRSEAILALPEGVAAPTPPAGLRVTAFYGGHPHPNQQSLRAARAMLDAARRLAEADAPGLLLALISGGGSAVAEWPLVGGLEPAQALYRRLVLSGAPIGEINTVRKHASAFKAGRLAAAAAGAQVDQVSWILSDVPSGDLSAVASGPTCPDATTLAEARAVMARWLPEHLEALVLQETPKPGDAAFSRSRWYMLADNAQACAHLAGLARAAGYAPVEVDATADEWESVAAARYLSGRWRQLRAQHSRPCLIAGGEVRVRAAGDLGRGGRNQHLALQVARALEGEEFCFLSAGTDGVDGSSDAAGAVVDGGTCARARAAGRDPEAHLRAFNAEPLLEATGDLVRTGPTGNNLRDVRLFLPRRAK